MAVGGEAVTEHTHIHLASTAETDYVLYRWESLFDKATNAVYFNKYLLNLTNQ